MDRRNGKWSGADTQLCRLENKGSLTQTGSLKINLTESTVFLFHQDWKAAKKQRKVLEKFTLLTPLYLYDFQLFFFTSRSCFDFLRRDLSPLVMWSEFYSQEINTSVHGIRNKHDVSYETTKSQ